MTMQMTHFETLPWILKQVDQAIALINPQGCLTEYSPIFAAWLGVAATELSDRPNLARLFATLLQQGQWSSSEVQQLEQAIAQLGALQTCQMASTVLSIRNTDIHLSRLPSDEIVLICKPGFSQLGDDHWARSPLSGLPDESNPGNCMKGTLPNDTGCLLTEASLLQRLLAIEAAIDGIAIVNPEGRFTYLNRAHLELFGYDHPDALIGQPWQILYSHTEALRIEQEILPRLFRDRHWRGEAIATRNDGTSFNEEVTLTLLEEGGLICVCRDISPLKQQQAALLQSEAKFRTLTETLPIASFIYQGTHLRYVNPAMTLITEYNPEELLQIDFWELIHPDHREMVKQRGLARQQGETVPERYEIKVLSKTGAVRWVDFRATLIDLDGKPAGLGTAVDITERKMTEETLRKSEEKYRQLMETASDALLIVEQSTGLVVDANRKATELLGRDRHQVLGMHQTQLYPPRLQLLYQNVFEEAALHPGTTTEVLVCGQDGQEIPAEVSANQIEMEGTYYLQGIFRDITDRKQTEEALRRAEEKYRSIFENAIEGIFQTTLEGRYLSANPALARLYGYPSPDELKARLTDINTQLYVNPQQRQEFIRLLQDEGKISQFESQVYRKDGSIIWISENAHVVRDRTGQVLHYEGTVEDITARKAAEEQLFIHAFYDSLTGLPNRALFMDRLQNALAHVHRRTDALFAVLFIDLDRFKMVNDTLGHLAGDQLLQQISQRLQQCVRVGDTVARLGGDEFAILLEDIQDLSDAIQVAERIQEQLMVPFHLQSQEVFTSASVGITLSRQSSGQLYQNLEDLLRDADTAMYRAKHRGKACHEVFDRTMNVDILTQLQLEADLRRAIEQEEFEVYYQPIVGLPRRQITGFEALVRWQHPIRGLLLPSEFIAIAEETGLIIPLGEWVIQQTCQHLKQWQREGLLDRSLQVSINLSERQFASPALALCITHALKSLHLIPNCLRFEITESVIMDNNTVVTHNLNQLKELGLQFCVDDFGTSYSSLSRLHRLPIDTLKIDRSFISRLSKRGENWAIVRTILNLANSLGIRAIAEGVETLDQLVQLTTLGCEYGQGYLFSQPLTAGAIVTLLQEQQAMEVRS